MCSRRQSICTLTPRPHCTRARTSAQAIYFGNAHWRGNSGQGNGPWVGADLEQGMYMGGGLTQTVKNPQNVPLPYPFVTAYLRGATDGFALKGGDATQGTLTTMYDGPRPFVAPNGTNTQGRKYQPSKKQGAIILATGGDYSNSAMGCFYEGYMCVEKRSPLLSCCQAPPPLTPLRNTHSHTRTLLRPPAAAPLAPRRVTGTTSDATDEAVQANIVAQRYSLV